MGSNPSFSGWKKIPKGIFFFYAKTKDEAERRAESNTTAAGGGWREYEILWETSGSSKCAETRRFRTEARRERFIARNKEFEAGVNRRANDYISRWAVQIPPSPVKRRYQKVSSFFMPRQRMKPSDARRGNKPRPPPVAGEGRGLLREIRSLKPEKTGAQTTIFRGGPFKSLLLRLKSPDFSGLIFCVLHFVLHFCLKQD